MDGFFIFEMILTLAFLGNWKTMCCFLNFLAHEKVSIALLALIFLPMAQLPQVTEDG